MRKIHFTINDRDNIKDVDHNNFNKRKCGVKWSEEEEKALNMGIEEYGPKFSKILEENKDKFDSTRVKSTLRDRKRAMKYKSSYTMAQKKTYVRITNEIFEKWTLDPKVGNKMSKGVYAKIFKGLECAIRNKEVKKPKYFKNKDFKYTRKHQEEESESCDDSEGEASSENSKSAALRENIDKVYNQKEFDTYFMKFPIEAANKITQIKSNDIAKIQKAFDLMKEDAFTEVLNNGTLKIFTVGVFDEKYEKIQISGRYAFEMSETAKNFFIVQKARFYQKKGGNK